MTSQTKTKRKYTGTTEISVKVLNFLPTSTDLLNLSLQHKYTNGSQLEQSSEENFAPENSLRQWGNFTKKNINIATRTGIEKNEIKREINNKLDETASKRTDNCTRNQREIQPNI